MDRRGESLLSASFNTCPRYSDSKTHKLFILSKLMFSVHAGAHLISLAGTGWCIGNCPSHPASSATGVPAVSVNTTAGKSLPDQTPARRSETERKDQQQRAELLQAVDNVYTLAKRKTGGCPHRKAWTKLFRRWCRHNKPSAVWDEYD